MKPPSRKFRALLAALTWGVALSVPAAAQDPQHVHQDAAPGWTVMQDGVVFGLFNSQGGPRGGREGLAINWWMGMASRKAGRGTLTISGMFSADTATATEDGYREIFQAGEVLDGAALVDRQHPHDLFMQVAAVWRTPLGGSSGLTIAGAPAGEPALGPVAFMHRLSSAENPSAPLAHHTLDSTHIAFGVITAAVDRGPWIAEASVFNGREPDDRRWDFDFGALDSYSGRVWFRPNDRWAFQASAGRLTSPETFEPGDVVRATASGSWMRTSSEDFTAVTAAFGRNFTNHGDRNALLVEGTRRSGANVVYSRFEAVQLETETFLFSGDEPFGIKSGAARVNRAGLPSDCDECRHDPRDTVLALTLGGLRDLFRVRGWEGGVGADVTFYGVPDPLTVTHGSRPVSFHVFFRVRPPAPMGRMWNMWMAKPGAHDVMSSPQ